MHSLHIIKMTVKQNAGITSQVIWLRFLVGKYELHSTFHQPRRRLKALNVCSKGQKPTRGHSSPQGCIPVAEASHQLIMSLLLP